LALVGNAQGGKVMSSFHLEDLETWQEAFVLPGIILFLEREPDADTISRLKQLVIDIEVANSYKKD
jgi:hypothetical protein